MSLPVLFYYFGSAEGHEYPGPATSQLLNI